MRSITICLHRGTGVIGKLIRWQTRGDYSHASIILPCGRFIEAREFIGVRELPRLVPAKGETVDRFTVEATEEQIAAVVEFLNRQLGKPYDYTMVARFVTRRQASREESGKWFCSELVFAALLHAGIILLRGTEPWEVSPSLLGRSPLLRRDLSPSHPGAPLLCT